MNRYAALIALSAYVAGCDPAGVPGPKDAADAEQRAYKIARDASDASAIALDVATIALHSAVEADAAKRAEVCKQSGKSGRDLQACQHQGGVAALAAGKAFADGIDAASKLQLELRDLLVEYSKCTPGTVDRICQASALAKAVEKSPQVKEAVEAARKQMRNVRVAN